MIPAFCVFCSQGKSQSNVKPRELHGEEGHTLKERTDKSTFPEVCLSQRTLVLFCSGIGDLISLVSHAVMAVFP